MFFIPIFINIGEGIDIPSLIWFVFKFMSPIIILMYIMFFAPLNIDSVEDNFGNNIGYRLEVGGSIFSKLDIYDKFIKLDCSCNTLSIKDNNGNVHEYYGDYLMYDDYTEVVRLLKDGSVVAYGYDGDISGSFKINKYIFRMWYWVFLKRIE